MAFASNTTRRTWRRSRVRSWAADADLRGKDFPAYEADPLGETLKAIEGIAVDAENRTAYADFCRDMVYGDDVPDFATDI